MDWNDVTPHLTGLAHIATVGADGVPAVAVVSPLVEDEQLWISTFRWSQKARNLAHRDEIAMMWQAGSEAYVWGSVAIVEEAATKARLWSQWPYDASGFFGTPDNPAVVLLQVTPSRATVLSHGASGPERSRWSI